MLTKVCTLEMTDWAVAMPAASSEAGLIGVVGAESTGIKSFAPARTVKRSPAPGVIARWRKSPICTPSAGGNEAVPAAVAPPKAKFMLLFTVGAAVTASASGLPRRSTQTGPLEKRP